MKQESAKKIAYALLGTVMIIIAVLVRSLADGGFELAVLLVLGLVLLLASIDLPILLPNHVGNRRQVGGWLLVGHGGQHRRGATYPARASNKSMRAMLCPRVST
ncbi:MAG: hypothetical protein M3473_06160 [Chloroflexota bacterium]|nr:hypothetical protein [Chloroflexota bacterium]